MRARLLTPFVLVGACLPEYTFPASTLAQDNTAALPPMAAVLLPSRTDAFMAWQLASDDPWAPYWKSTLLAALEDVPQRVMMPDVLTMPSVRAASVAAERIAAAGLPEDTLWMVDLHGAASVSFGVALTRVSAAPVSLVPTFNNWPAEEELVPAEETLSALVQMRPMPPNGMDGLHGTTRPVFLLDSWRMAWPDSEPEDYVVDNRYALTPSDFPSAEVLVARGIRRVAYVVDDHLTRPLEEDDLNQVFMAWQEAGIAVDVIDLGDLLGVPPDVEVGMYLDVHLFHVLRRITHLQDPRFYQRAHGGFGGMYARPATYAYATNYGAGHGGG